MLWSEITTIVTDLTDASTTDFPTATRLIYANQAQAKVSNWILGTNGNWQWDDTNQTDYPIGKGDLEDGVGEYSLPMIDDDIMFLSGISILDASGKYQKLFPIDKRDMGVDPSQFQPTNGMPTHYDKQDDAVTLYPAPASGSVTLVNGFKIFYQRKTKDITEFGSTSPGFVPTNHEVLAYMIALPYCMKYKKDRVGLYKQEILEQKEAIETHYSRRTKDEPRRMSVSQERSDRGRGSRHGNRYGNASGRLY